MSSRIARFEVFQRLFKAKICDEESVNDHCLIMTKDIEELQKLDMNMDKELQMDLNLQSLPDLFGQLIMYYYMNKIDNTLLELLNMLVTVEDILKSSKGTV